MYIISIGTHLKKVLNHIISIIFTDNYLVDFVMNFTLGNLTRRLRSAPIPNQSCSMDTGCLAEVVSRTFTELVLDNHKV
jgi:hypothetical protein